MFIAGSCDIGFLCSKMQIEAHYAGYDMELTNIDFENKIERHEEKSKVEEVVEKSM
mgnify:CR=1 FL=1